MGSKSTQSTQIPEYIEEAGKLALQRAQAIQAMGYVPYMGPEVAAINPYEQAMATNVGSMASAFGLAAPVGMDMGSMPTVTQGGMTGYTSYPAYMSALERLRETRPEQYEYFSGMTRFDPITGALNPDYDAVMQDVIAPQVTAPAASSGGGGGNDDSLSHAEIMQMHYGNPNGPSPKKSGGFDPLGPSGNYSLDLSETPVGKIFGGLNKAIGN